MSYLTYIIILLLLHDCPKWKGKGKDKTKINSGSSKSVTVIFHKKFELNFKKIPL